MTNTGKDAASEDDVLAHLIRYPSITHNEDFKWALHLPDIPPGGGQFR